MEQGAFLPFYEQHKETLYHYACTLTAQRFSSHQPPRELLVYGDGRVETK